MNNDFFEDNEDDLEWGLPEGPPPKLNLPFAKKRKKGAGEWVYDNRETICISVIIYLLIAIGIVTSKIILQPQDKDAVIVVDFFDPEEMKRLEDELQRARELNRLLNEMTPDYGSVKNLASNENASAEELKESMSDETREIFERSEEVLQDMNRNSQEYEQMLAMIEQQKRNQSLSETSSERRDAKIDGTVTVSYSLGDPVRNATRLHVPAYKCLGGGVVVVDIVVDRNGEVVSANVNKSSSSGDNCMTTTALDAARNSRFNVDQTAPSRHSGTITYVYVPQ